MKKNILKDPKPIHKNPEQIGNRNFYMLIKNIYKNSTVRIRLEVRKDGELNGDLFQ